MRPGQMTIRLEPVHGGVYTRLRLCGTLPTALPRPIAARFLRELAFWSGWPVSCALSADEEAAFWCDWWTDLTADISVQHLELCIRRRRPEQARDRRGDR